jgi:hypothetical protein
MCYHVLSSSEISDSIRELNILTKSVFSISISFCIKCLKWFFVYFLGTSGIPKNFVRGGGGQHSVEVRENGDLGAVGP